MSKKNSLSTLLWDIWCTVSIIGIWPRFIEPNLLTTTRLQLTVKHLPKQLEGLRIVQFSDLHVHSKISNRFLNRLATKINRLKPDLIVFCGDVLCYGKIYHQERIVNFFNKLSAPYGCYAIYGNHDYAGCISVNEKGDYDIWRGSNSSLVEGYKRLFGPEIVLSRKVTDGVKAIPENQELRHIWSQTPFTLLHNESVLVPINGTKLNIVGLGEYIMGRCLPEQAFAKHDKNYPTLVLAHNPDSINILENYPADIMLSGHTHGGQINLPWVWRKLTIMENPHLKKGLFKFKKRWLYINRGIGESMPFRWFAPPEILSLTLENDGK